MVTGVDAATALVLIVKFALLLPAGTVTLEETLAAPLLLESITCAPPAGAGPLSVTVPVDDCTPPKRPRRNNGSVGTVGRGGGITFIEAEVLAHPYVPSLPTRRSSDLALVLIVKFALLLPAGTVTLEETLAAPLLLESITCAPPAGAGPLSVTVPVDDC